MTLRTKIEVFTDFTFVRSGPSYMHCCRAFPLRQLGFLVYIYYIKDRVLNTCNNICVRESTCLELLQRFGLLKVLSLNVELTRK